MSLRQLTYDVGIVLGTLRVPYTITSVVKNITTQYIVEDFGVVVSVMNPGDYVLITDRLESLLKDYRIVLVTEHDNFEEKRYEIIWSLMQSGYIRWLRMLYPAQFPTILEAGNLCNLIIDERLKRWANKPMYKFLIQDNIEARKLGLRRMLSQDPGFYDFMP